MASIYKGQNYHDGFINIDKRNKKGMAIFKAHDWQKDIGRQHLEKAQQLAEQKYRKFVSNGGSLSQIQLQKLNTHWKNIYTNQKFKEGKEIMKQ